MFCNEENYKQMKPFFHLNLTQYYLSICSQTIPLSSEFHVLTSCKHVLVLDGKIPFSLLVRECIYSI